MTTAAAGIPPPQAQQAVVTCIGAISRELHLFTARRIPLSTGNRETSNEISPLFGLLVDDDCALPALRNIEGISVVISDICSRRVRLASK